jgi:hypothetical protein
MSSSGSGRGSRTTFSPALVLVIVFGVFIVSQLVVLAILGAEASAAPTVTQNCQLNFWVIHLACSDVSTQNANAFQAQQLAQLLGPVFAVLDGLFIVVVALVVVSSSRARSSGRRVGR